MVAAGGAYIHTVYNRLRFNHTVSFESLQGTTVHPHTETYKHNAQNSQPQTSATR